MKKLLKSYLKQFKNFQGNFGYKLYKSVKLGNIILESNFFWR